MYFFLTFISSYLGLVQQEGFENLEAIRSAGVKVILLAKSHFFFCCFLRVLRVLRGVAVGW